MVPNPKVAIVILNYLNDNDTVECVESAFTLEGGPYDIIVVDNASHNGAYERLQQRFGADARVTLLRTPRNLGFARGNNVGIRYARRYKKADFVLVVNNDTVFTNPAYISEMLDACEPSVGIAGSRICLPGEKIQKPYGTYFSWDDCWKKWINLCSETQGGCFDFRPARQQYHIMLHGSALLFTPAFFRRYRGFYPRTFLYHEEEILYLMCLCAGLQERYVDKAEIFHKEDQSSGQSFGNASEVKNKFLAQSYKWVVWWNIKAHLLKKLPQKT